MLKFKLLESKYVNLERHLNINLKVNLKSNIAEKSFIAISFNMQAFDRIRGERGFLCAIN